MFRLSDTALDEYARQIMAHLEFHSAYIAPPATFQFVLPDGRYLSVNDAVAGRRRSLYFFGYDRLKPNLARRVSAVLPRARRSTVEGAWSFGETDREQRKALRTIRHAVEIAYGGRGTGDTDREPTAILIDPRESPARLDELPGAHRTIEQEGGEA